MPPVRCEGDPFGIAHLIMETYEDRLRRLIADLRHTAGEPVRLGKDTSNLFRSRSAQRGGSLNVRDMRNVLALDSDAGWVEVEGMTTYESLVDATLPHGRMPAVVPQLKSITIGGAVCGIGIESSSFRYGFPHETVLEMDVLLGHGEVLTCTPTNQHRDLFFAMPNSYGTLGYITRLKAATVPVKPFVQLTHIAVKDPHEYFATIEKWCGADVDFIDGVVFDKGQHYVTIGRFVEDAPYSSDYTWRDIYYRSIRERSGDYLTTKDYIWRWDTDWFWCSKNLFAQKPLVRRLLGKKRLNSAFYTKVMRWNGRWGVTRLLNRLRGKRPETVIQDVDIPIENGPAFLDFFQREIGIRPLWVCPIGHCHWDSAALGLPNRPLSEREQLFVLSSRCQQTLRQLRVLGLGAQPQAFAGRSFQSTDRGQSRTTGGHQITLFRRLLCGRGILAPL